MDRDGVRATWAQSNLYRHVFVIGTFATLALGTVVFVGTLTVWRTEPGLRIVAVLWIILGLWSGYWACWRLSYYLTLTDESVLWRGVLRRGEVPLDAVERVVRSASAPWKGMGAVRIVTTSGPTILLMEGEGLSTFVGKMKLLAPEINVESTFGGPGRRQRM